MCGFALLLLGVNVAKAEELPLFASGEPLNVTLDIPLSPFLERATEKPVEFGELHFLGADGKEISVTVKITTRGKSRLEHCRIPPLSMTFTKKKSLVGTVFEGQKRLKIVTRCKDMRDYRRYQLQEFSVYRAFNILSDVSFRVRQLNVTYRDADDPGRSVEGNVFLIESVKELANRLKLERPSVGKLREAQLDPSYTTLSAMFQFLIGNTDWSVIMGPSKDRCCHNGKILAPEGSTEGWMVVPYDFDQAGIINTVYAAPANELPIRSVRQRLFRGRCIHADHIDSVTALFNERRPQLEAALAPSELGTRFRKATLAYIDNFYRITNDPKQRKRHVDGSCLGR
jgi:hypothetical protein